MPRVSFHSSVLGHKHLLSQMRRCFRQRDVSLSQIRRCLPRIGVATRDREDSNGRPTVVSFCHNSDVHEYNAVVNTLRYAGLREASFRSWRPPPARWAGSPDASSGKRVQLRFAGAWGQWRGGKISRQTEVYEGLKSDRVRILNGSASAIRGMLEIAIKHARSMPDVAIAPKASLHGALSVSPALLLFLALFVLVALFFSHGALRRLAP